MSCSCWELWVLPCLLMDGAVWFNETAVRRAAGIRSFPIGWRKSILDWESVALFLCEKGTCSRREEQMTAQRTQLVRACGEQERQQGVSGFYAEQIIRVKIPPRSLKLQHLSLLQCLRPAWVMRRVVPGVWGDTVPAAMSPNGTALIPHPNGRAGSSLEAFFPPHHSSALAPALPPCTNAERNPQLWVRQNQAQGKEMGKKPQGSRRLAGSGCRSTC